MCLLLAGGLGSASISTVLSNMSLIFSPRVGVKPHTYHSGQFDLFLCVQLLTVFLNFVFQSIAHCHTFRVGMWLDWC